MRKALDYILERLPDQSARIIELYNKAEDFRILCEDFYASSQALDECRKNLIKDKLVENEFLEVNLDLEKEINHLLSR